MGVPTFHSIRCPSVGDYYKKAFPSGRWDLASSGWVSVLGVTGSLTVVVGHHH